MKKIVVAFMFVLLCGVANGTEFLRHTFTTQLTTPNSTEAISTFRNGEFMTNHLWQYVVSGVSNNVVVKAVASLDATNYFNVEAATTTKDANGTYIINAVNMPIAYTKFTLVSEDGATTATIDVKYMGSN